MVTILKSVLAPEMNAYAEMLYGVERDIEEYLTVFKSLDAFMLKAGAKTKELSERLVLDWINSLSMVRRTKNGYIARTRKFARYLTAMGIPAYEPDFCKETRTFVEYTFSDEEFSAIIEIADNATANAFKSPTECIFPVLLRVLYGCGLRIQETLVLQWRDVNLETGVITILEAKNNRQRYVPMSKSLCELLRQYKRRRFPVNCESEYLFGNPGKNGMPYIKSTFRYWFQRVMTQANISNERKQHFERIISTHTLRHYFTFKSFLKSEAEGRSIDEAVPVLSAYLGHETFHSTERYLTGDYTVYTDSQEKVYAVIESLFPEVSFE